MAMGKPIERHEVEKFYHHEFDIVTHLADQSAHPSVSRDCLLTLESRYSLSDLR